LKQLKNNGVTVLCANIDTSKEPAMAGLIEKSKVVDIDGHKIGIIGYIGADADVSP
jgi:2',3'-cyclic-nucleotide 2'-phosphodiesterase (5'-nucleotidase family)